MPTELWEMAARRPSYPGDLNRSLNSLGKRDRAHARSLMASDLYSQEKKDSAAARQDARQGSRIRTSGPARRMIGIAARLLPSAHRPRYTEEYEAELYELAQVSRRAQWAFAARILAHVLQLRRELRRDSHEAARG